VAVLIDGNNLLFAAHDADPDRPVGRGKLCELLGRWGLRARQRIAVVFDGSAPPGGLAEQISGEQVEVAFSGAGVKADAVIAERIERDSGPRHLLVVSTDREVAKAARRRQAVAMRSDEFWRCVLEDLARPAEVALEPIEKRRGLAAGQADDWVQHLGLKDLRDPNAFPE
jgi:predicted RNA-binding protein with PIN domain